MPTRRTILKSTIAGAAVALVPSIHLRAAETLRWSVGPGLPIPLQEIYATAHQGEIWIAGGLTPDQSGNISVSDRSFALDPQSLIWREGPRLSEPMHHPQLLSTGDDLYLIGGFRAANSGIWSMRDNVQIMDGSTWRTAPPLVMPLAESHGAVLDGKLHLAGGRRPAGEANAQWRDHTDTDIHLKFDPQSQEWTRAASLPAPRNSGAGVAAGGKFYVIGGRTVDGGNSDSVNRFNPATGEWQACAPMPEARGGIAAAQSDGNILIFGGEYLNGPNGAGVFETVLEYSITHNVWSTLGPMPHPRHGLAANAFNQNIIVIGGAIHAGANGTVNTVTILNPLFSPKYERI